MAEKNKLDWSRLETKQTGQDEVFPWTVKPGGVCDKYQHGNLRRKWK